MGVGDADVVLIKTVAQDFGAEPAIGLELAQVVEEPAQGGARGVQASALRRLVSNCAADAMGVPFGLTVRRRQEGGEARWLEAYETIG